MSEKMKWLEKYAPLGIGVEKQIKAFIAGGAIATLYSMLFFREYAIARAELYEHTTTGKKLIEGAIIQSFGGLTYYIFLGFNIMITITFLCSAFFYFYHYDGSKMIYLMKRLPNKWELLRRCVTLPIAGVIILFAWMNFLRLLYFAIYLIITPSQCLPL